jgi:hypothetical protein
MDVLAGSTDVTTYFKLKLLADGSPADALVITDLDLQYVRSGVAPVAKVDATALAATDSAHADNKAIAVDATDQPGLYRVDWPDAAFVAGVREVILTVKHTDIGSEDLRVNLTPVPANVMQIGSSTQSQADLKDLADTGYDPVTHTVLLTSAERNKIADHVRRRTQANVEASSDGDTLDLSSEYGFIQQAQESSVLAGTLTVKKTDGSTTLGTKALTTTSGANPVTGIS